MERCIVLGALVLALCAAASCAGARLEQAGPQESADRARPSVERVRGLRFVKPVGARAQTKEERRSELQHQSAARRGERSPGFALEIAAYQLFGLLEPEFDAESAYTDLNTESVAAYYESEEQRLTLIRTDRAGADGEAVVFGHELVHALQDQHFDLGALQKVKRDNDATMALRALIEGDATAAGYDYGLFRELQASSTSDDEMRGALLLLLALARTLEVARSTSPPLLVENQLFRYEGGFGFVTAIRAERGWAGVDALYADPPESTEQILYPERYLDWRERPVSIQLASAPDGWKSSYENNLGLFETRLLLRSQDVWSADDLASAWDGDRYALWESEEGRALVWYTVWNGTAAARRFAEAYGGALAASDPRGDTWAIATEGRAVMVVPFAPSGCAAALLAQLRGSGFTPPPDSTRPSAPVPGGIAGLALRTQRLAGGREVAVLNGLLASYRGGETSTRAELLTGLALRTASGPQSFRLNLAADCVGVRWDAQRGDAELRLVPALRAYRRGDAFAVSLLQEPLFGITALRVGHSPELDLVEIGSLVRWRREAERLRFSLPLGLLEYTRTADERALRALRVPFTSRWLLCAGCSAAAPAAPPASEAAAAQ